MYGSVFSNIFFNVLCFSYHLFGSIYTWAKK